MHVEHRARPTHAPRKSREPLNEHRRAVALHFEAIEVLTIDFNGEHVGELPHPLVTGELPHEIVSAHRRGALADGEHAAAEAHTETALQRSALIHPRTRTENRAHIRNRQRTVPVHLEENNVRHC